MNIFKYSLLPHPAQPLEPGIDQSFRRAVSRSGRTSIQAYKQPREFVPMHAMLDLVVLYRCMSALRRIVQI